MSDILNRLPLTTMIGAIAAFVGLAISSYALSKTTKVEDYFDKNVVARESKDQEFNYILDVTTLVLTFFVVLLIVFIAFMGTADTENECADAFSSKVALSLLISIATLFCLIWHVYGCYIARRQGNTSADVNDCNQHFKSGNATNGTCLSVSFIKDVDNRKLCEPEKIKNFCNKYTPDIEGCLYLSKWGSFITLIGLLGLSEAVASNTVLTIMETDLGVDDFQPRRY